jgi:hypothetical protein
MKKGEVYKTRKAIQKYGDATIIRFNKSEAEAWDFKEGDIYEIEMRRVK